MTALWTRTAADPPEALLLHRSEPEARAVLENWYLTVGSRLIVAAIPQAKIDGYGGGDGGGGGDGDGDGGGYGGGGGYGDGDGDGGGCGCGYRDGDGGGYGDGGVGRGVGGYGDVYGDGILEQEDPVEGLMLVVLGGGYYPYVLVGWIRRVAGDEYDVVGARCVRRFGESQALAGLAARGPFRERGKQPTELLEAAALPERIHRLLVRRCLPCDEKAWAKDCPRPEGWAAGSAGRP